MTDHYGATRGFHLLSYHKAALMKWLHFFLILLLFPFYSCNKKEAIVKTFTGNLPIVLINTPITARAGEDIVSKVRCELPSISGTVIFKGFEIREIASRQFNLTAKALYKDWNTQIEMPVIWTLDTTASIRAATTGQYILHFYNAALLVKSDTVLVN